jgi:hypothetical protein
VLWSTPWQCYGVFVWHTIGMPEDGCYILTVIEAATKHACFVIENDRAGATSGR